MMATCLPGDILARAWGRQIGRLQPGAEADLVVIKAKRGANPFSTVVDAIEEDIDLVVIGGQPRYGAPDLMSSASTVTALTVAGRTMQLSLSQPSNLTKAWEWSEVIDRMEEVRAHPKREVEAANAMYARWAGRLDDREAPLRLALDMPTGLAPVGGLPKDLDELVVPPLQSLTHDGEWLDSVVGRGFHSGVLDDLAKFYRR
jgi:hypothetical protein